MDDGFTIESPTALNARETAKKLLQWCDNPAHHLALCSFAEDLAQQLYACLHVKYKSQGANRERMWGAFHKLRTSDSYLAKWKLFLSQSVSVEACPIFYQYVSDTMFKAVLKSSFPVEQRAPIAREPSLSYDEKNALRYAAGFVPLSLRKKLERSAHPLKEELILCLRDMTEDDNTPDCSEDWTNLIDRGGLKHVNNVMYMLMATMEIEVRQHLPRGPTTENLKEKIMENILKNEDVMFYWALLSANWDEEAGHALLPMTADLWVTMRGFSYVSAWMEQHKKISKKNIQKSKGIRKRLCDSSSSQTQD